MFMMTKGAYTKHAKSFQVSSAGFRDSYWELCGKAVVFLLLATVLIQSVFLLRKPPVTQKTFVEVQLFREEMSNRSAPLVHIGIHSEPRQMLNRAFIRTLMKQSLPSDFSYEFVFSKEGLSGSVAHIIAAEMMTYGDIVIVAENTGRQSVSHFRTLRWIQHAIASKPLAKYYVKTDDDSFIAYERLKFLVEGLNSTHNFIFFGRDDFVNRVENPAQTYMVGFMYGLSNALAKQIVANVTGVIIMKEEGYSEDLQTSHWIHLLQKQNRSFDGIFKKFYSQVQNMSFSPLDVQWIDWGMYIGQADWLASSANWARPITNETLVIHGLKGQEHFFTAVKAFCGTFTSEESKFGEICFKTRSFWEKEMDAIG